MYLYYSHSIVAHTIHQHHIENSSSAMKSIYTESPRVCHAFVATARDLDLDILH